MKICFFPVISDAAALTDHYYRLHWYLLPFKDKIDEIVLPVASRTLKPGACPSYLDAGLSDMVGRLPVRIIVVDDGATRAELEAAEIILKWSVGSKSEKQFATVLDGKPALRIDHDRVRYAGSLYLKFRVEFDALLGQPGKSYLGQSKGVYDRILERCKSDICYIFGTGPGLAEANDMDFSDGVCIACNSMVKNTDLLDRLEPPLIVVGDPIFHAGPSSYAAAFREKLVDALDRYDADLIVPMRDYHIYAEHLPKRFLDRIAAVPFKHGDVPHHRLDEEFHVTTTANVLTLFLLPLAANFSETIRVLGCDGRPLKENDYFWGHDKASQFNDEMDDIKRAHPGFFDIDYDDYYAEHCQTLETWLTHLEAAGKTITNHTFSHIPALSTRSVGHIAQIGTRILEPDPVDTEDLVSIVMPAFNTEGFIGQAIESVIAQSYPNWELLIIDDGSTDDTPKIVERFSAADDRVKLFRNPGKYQAEARNHGIDQAGGKYLCFLDSDDVMHPCGLEVRVDYLQQNTGVNLVHGIVTRIGEDGRDLNSPLAKMGPVSFRDMHANPFHINGIMGETELFDRHRLKYHVPSGEDWMMMARILRMGHVSHFVPEEVAAWRYHPSSATQRGMGAHEAVLEQTLNWVYSVCDPDDSAPVYLEGLSKPALADVKLRRKTNVLIWNVLTGDMEGIEKLLQSPQVTAFFGKVSPQNWTSLTRSAGLRYFRVPHDELPGIDRAHLCEVSERLVMSGIKDELPSAYHGISRAFGLPALRREPLGPDKLPFLECSREDARHVDEVAALKRIVGTHDPSGKHLITLGREAAGYTKGFTDIGWKADHLGQVSDDRSAPVDLETIDRRPMTGAAVKRLLELKSIPEISLLGIDVAGLEHAVLRSVPWNRARPEIVVCSFYDGGLSADGLGVEDIGQVLESRHFSVYVSEWFAPGPDEELTAKAWRRIIPFSHRISVPAHAWGRLIGFRDDPGFDRLRAAFAAELVSHAKPNKKLAKSAHTS